jgi:glycosyltransferase involved in cell wall biosynthesis
VLLVEAAEDGTSGGSHRALADLVAHLDPARFAPIVLFYEDTPFATRLPRARVHVWTAERARERRHHGPVGRLHQLLGPLEAIPRRVAFLRREAIDLVHLNNAPSRGLEDWLPAALLLRRPCIAHVRGAFVLPRSAFARRLARGFAAVLPVSAAMADVARAQGIPEASLRVVHDGIDGPAVLARLRTPAPELRRALGLAPDALVVSLVAHLRRWKGHALALDALARLPESLRARMVLLFVGAAPKEDPGFEDELRRRAASLGVAAQVRFLGARDDVPDLMAASDVLLHASTDPEPFGLVLLEAMTLGRPVVASRPGGPSEIVAPGSGVLFDPRDPGELAHALESLALDPALRLQLGEAGRQRAAAFTVESTVRRIESIYEEVAGRSRAPAGAPG